MRSCRAPHFWKFGDSKRLFETVKVSKNTDLYNYSYSEYHTRFDSHSHFSFPNFDWSINVVIFGVDYSSSIHIDNKKKVSLVWVVLQSVT